MQAKVGKAKPEPKNFQVVSIFLFSRHKVLITELCKKIIFASFSLKNTVVHIKLS